PRRRHQRRCRPDLASFVRTSRRRLPPSCRPPPMILPRLVVVSPLPPTWSGIADYTSRLLPYLSQHWSITVVVADDDPEPTGMPDGVQAVTASSWDTTRRVMLVERMLHCLGNSRHHVHIPAMCR